MARSLPPLRPRPQLHREPHEPSSPLSLQQQALVAVPNPSCESIEMYEDLNWSTSLIVL